MSKNDGGPAFGHAAENGHCCGATLRDLFAAAAVAGLCANPNGIRKESDACNLAASCWAVADAMLAAREEPMHASDPNYYEYGTARWWRNAIADVIDANYLESHGGAVADALRARQEGETDAE